MISATVLTHNNARTIGETVNSLKGVADELVIIDDSSSDETLSIVRSLWPDARIFTRSLNRDFAAQRNFSLEQCSFDWAIIIDSDEYLDAELGQAIKNAARHPGDTRLFNCIISNKNFADPTPIALGRPILMHTDERFQSSIHEFVPGAMVMLPGILYHNAWAGVADFIDDLNVYSGYKAATWIEQGRNYSVPFTVMRQTAAFFYFFIKRFVGEKRYRGGWKGFLYCLSWASEELFTGMKYIEQRERKPAKGE